MNKIAILQSNYIPWKGYFDIINRVDNFILYDDMQYTRRDWRNRNKIKTSSGLIWLTIPVEVKGKFEQKICDTVVSDNKWVDEHFKTITHNYSKARFFTQNKDWLENIYNLVRKESHLSKVNYIFIKEISNYLGIKTQLSWSMDYSAKGTKTDRLISICKEAKATHYLSGPSAKNYIEEEKFKEASIQLEWMDYAHYPEYQQLFPPFEHGVSVLDLIFNVGSDAPSFIISK